MKILRFDKSKANLVELGDHAYMVHRNNAGKYLLIRATCPHRGGPLFLGEILKDPTESIRCPWHESVASVHVLRKKAPPMVVNGSACQVVVKDTDCETSIRWVTRLTNKNPCRAICA